jgi:ribose 5-phosphate isomerase A
MTRDDQKRAAAEAALEYVDAGSTIGVGTGSTAALFIERLAELPPARRPAAAASSSDTTAAALWAAGIRLVGLEDALPLPLYVDGADEVDPELRLIKGRGGAHAREKVLASAAELFVCIVDETKLVERLGAGAALAPGTGAPVPLAVLPMAAAFVAERVRALGGRPATRPGYLTDDGAAVLDVSGLDLTDPERLEVELEAVPGVVASGLFARRRADVVLAGTASGMRILRRGRE